MKPTVIDLFAGVGGLSLGFRQSGFDIVFANEHDLEIATAYKHNHKNVNMIISDIQKLPIEETFSQYRGKIDVVIGGPPCQGFSQKGRRKTILDERNFLFKYFIEVVKFVKPKYFVMENVPNLFTAENGYFRNQIATLFQKTGYSIQMGILNASDYGVPQNRRRAVILGKLGVESLNLPEAVENKVSIWDAISDLAFLESGEGCESQAYRQDVQSQYQQELRGKTQKLFNHVATKHSSIAIKKMNMIPPECGKEMLPKEYLTKSIYSGTWNRMKKKEISVTITTRFDTPSSGEFMHPYLNRAITVREAARIQSFPDDFIFIGTKGSQMKQVGNAVPPKLAKSIADKIMVDIKRS